MLQNIYTYLNAAIEIKSEIEKPIKAEFERFNALVALPAIDSSDLARTVIELENIFADKKDFDIHADIIARMNIFRTEVANTILADLRQGENDFLDDIEKATAAQKSQQLKREEPYQTDFLLLKKD